MSESKNEIHNQAMDSIITGFQALGFTVTPTTNSRANIKRGVSILWGLNGEAAIHIQILTDGRIMLGVECSNWQSRTR